MVVLKADSHVAVYRYEYDVRSMVSYLHKNIIFLVIILILKHALFRVMQKYLSPVISCLLCCMNWYSWSNSQIASYPYTFAWYSYCCKILQPYVAATVRMHSDAVLSSTCALLMKTVIKIIANNKWSTFASAGFCGRIHVNQPLWICFRNVTDWSIMADFQISKHCVVA